MPGRHDRGAVRLLTRTGLDWTHKYPAIASALSSLPAAQAYLDGELCGVRPDGTTSFSMIQAALRRQHSGDRRCACARWRRAAPYGHRPALTALITTRLGAITPADRLMGRPSRLRPARSSSRSGRGRSAKFAQGLAPDAAIRHDDLHLVVGHELGPEQRQFVDRSDAATDLHLVANSEGPEDQQHDARRQVGESALQGEADRQAGGAEDGHEARRMDSELRQHREHRDGQN
jgi:hypothetical protein